MADFLKARSMPKAELARKAEVSHGTVRNILAGEGITAENLAKLRRVHGLGQLQAEHFLRNEQ